MSSKLRMKKHIADRLLLERKRLGHSQAEMATIGQVHIRTYQLYEKGARVPDAECLAGLYGRGVDILYVVTGVRSEGLLDAESSDLFSELEKSHPHIRKAAVAAAWAVINSFADE